MDRELYELAEAAMGLSHEMQWSLSEDIARRELTRLFNRCSLGTLPAELALDIFVDHVTTKRTHNMGIIDQRLESLLVKLNHYDLRRRPPDTPQAHKQLPALLELTEFFMGVTQEAEWAIDDNITRKELYPIFARCALGKLTGDQALDACLDNMVAKRDYLLDLVQKMVARLSLQIKESTLDLQNKKVTNGEEAK